MIECPSAEHSFYVNIRPPFRLNLTVWALRRRPINQIDRWDGSTYRRTVYVEESPMELAVKQTGTATAPRLRVTVSGEISGNGRARVRALLSRVLGLGIDLSPFYTLASREPPLDDLAKRFRGVRPPRFPTFFEALVNGISCQQLSLQAGLTLLNRFVGAYGRPAPLSATEGKAFPRPQDLGRATVESLRALGFSRSKAIAVIEAAVASADDEIELEAISSLDDEAARAKLDELRGIGRWTAEYVLLRGYGRLNIFPGDDIGARKNLQQWLGLRHPLDYGSTTKVLRHWQPYGGLVYLHLLLKQLNDRGLLYPGPLAISCSNSSSARRPSRSR